MAATRVDWTIVMVEHLNTQVPLEATFRSGQGRKLPSPRCPCPPPRPTPPPLSPQLRTPRRTGDAKGMTHPGTSHAGKCPSTSCPECPWSLKVPRPKPRPNQLRSRHPILSNWQRMLGCMRTLRVIFKDPSLAVTFMNGTKAIIFQSHSLCDTPPSLSAPLSCPSQRCSRCGLWARPGLKLSTSLHPHNPHLTPCRTPNHPPWPPSTTPRPLKARHCCRTFTPSCPRRPDKLGSKPNHPHGTKANQLLAGSL